MPGECIVCVELCGGPSELRKAVEIIVTIMEAFHASCDNGQRARVVPSGYGAYNVWPFWTRSVGTYVHAENPSRGSKGEALEMWDTERRTRIDQLQNNLS